MFTSKEIGFQVCDYNTRVNDQNVARFIYSAEQNDIVTLHNRSYEYVFENATGRMLRLLLNPNFRVPNVDVMRLLQLTIKFNTNLYSSSTNGGASVYLGMYDIYLIPAIGLFPSESLLPTLKTDEKLWISEARMTGSPTYFIEMFHFALWLSFLVFFLTIGFLSTFSINRLKKFSTSPTDTFTWFSIITQQGADARPNFTSQQLVLFSLSILTIMFYGSFEAFMSSYLAMRKPDLPFNDLTGLLQAKEYTICIPMLSQDVYGYVETDLIASQMNVDRLNSERCPGIFRTLNLNYAADALKVKNTTNCPLGNTAILTSNVWRLFDQTQDNCRIMLLSGSYFPRYVTMQVAQSFKYRDHLNQGIIRQMSAGHMNYLQKYAYRHANTERSRTYIYDEDIVASINLHQTKLVFGILICGMAISFLVLVGETIIHY